MSPVLSRRVAVESMVAAAISLVLALLILLPLLSQMDNAWFGADMLSQYDTSRAWNGLHFATTDQVGFPFGQVRDVWPSTDLLNNGFTRLLILATGSVFTGVNLLILISFPLAGALALIAIRLTGMGGQVAVALAVAFANIPYHWGRSLNHAYLATTASMVTGMILVLLVASGRWDRACRAGSGQRRAIRIGLVAVLVCVTAWGGIYYAVFTLLFGAAAVVWRIAKRDRWASIALASTPFAGITVLVVAGLLPSLIAARDVTGSVVVRSASEAVRYAGNIGALVLPGAISPIPAYSSWVEQVFGTPPIFENVQAGAFGTIVTTSCLLVFIVAMILRAVRRLPVSPPHPSGVTAGLIGFLLLVALAFFIPHGPNYLISVVIPQIRAWNRLTPALLLLFILAACVVIRGTSWEASARKPLYTSVAIVLLTILGVIAPFRANVVSAADEYVGMTQQARNYAQQVNDEIPEDCGVLQLPVLDFPEGATTRADWLDEKWGDYAHLLVSLTNTEKKWSYGAMKGTPAAAWQSNIGLIPSESDYAFLRDHGFCAIHLDRNAYLPGKAAEVEQALTSRFGAPAVQNRQAGWSLWRVWDWKN